MRLPLEFSMRHGDWELRGERFAPEHVPAVLELENACFPCPWSETLLRQEAEVRDYAWNLVVRVDGTVKAFFFNWTVLDEMHLLNFAVHPDLHGAGLGGALLDWMLSAAVAAGFHSINLEVRASNKSAQALYASRGFRLVHRRLGYYSDNGEDALIMLLVFDESGLGSASL